ncbi:MAG TPA: 4Fe-4S binding protein [Patescibacteria group bacterium]|nr:4Fe-4S binding protein [Patescibacteria group bacterium]
MAILRRLSQAFFLCLFVYILWSTTYPLKGLLPPETFFTLDPLIMAAVSLSGRLLLSGLAVSACLLLLTLAVGRFFCGWVCPLGACIDAAGLLNRKRSDVSDAHNRRMRSVKFYILLIILVCAVFGIQLAWVFDPMVIMARSVSLNLIPGLTFAMNKAFVFLVRDLGWTGGVLDLYRALKASLLGVNIYYFSHSFIILLFFIFVVGTSAVLKRFWCRALCPLGALYAFFASVALLGRAVTSCTHCRQCKSRCRMGAIKDDASYIKGECILCLDCLYDCPVQATRFQWSFLPSAETKPAPSGGAGINRRDFLFLACSLLLALGARFRGEETLDATRRAVIRPPGAPPEKEFLDRCIRCGNCMKVCITNGLQPVMLQTGIAGLWTPQLVPETGYCEYSCTLCGKVCPTQAIPSLSVEQKHRTSLGLAVIDRAMCLPWARHEQCIVCQEHCPVSSKAIKLQEDSLYGPAVLKPYVEAQLCIGCGICQNKCPVRPTRAIRVRPL